MKKDIHPDYVECKVTCTCGNTFTTRATKPELRIDICNACHPFFTGTQKLIDSGGRVQRFTDRFGAAKDKVAEREAAKKAATKEANEQREAEKRAEREAKAAAKAKRAEEYAAKAAKEEAEAAKKAEAEEAKADEATESAEGDASAEATTDAPTETEATDADKKEDTAE